MVKVRESSSCLKRPTFSHKDAIIRTRVVRVAGSTFSSENILPDSFWIRSCYSTIVVGSRNCTQLIFHKLSVSPPSPTADVPTPRVFFSTTRCLYYDDGFLTHLEDTVRSQTHVLYGNLTKRIPLDRKSAAVHSALVPQDPANPDRCLPATSDPVMSGVLSTQEPRFFKLLIALGVELLLGSAVPSPRGELSCRFYACRELN